MGEYARVRNGKSNAGEEIKIGTCANMYYLRFEDRFSVDHIAGNVNPAKEFGLNFRLPFPDEDGLPLGEIKDGYRRGVRLYRMVPSTAVYGREYVEDYHDESLAKDSGLIQLTHPSGLLVNVTCYHGMKLPQATEEVGFHWNGKSHSIELVSVKHVSKGVVKPVISCRHCGQAWRTDWADIEAYIPDEMKKRLAQYIEAEKQS